MARLAMTLLKNAGVTASDRSAKTLSWRITCFCPADRPPPRVVLERERVQVNVDDVHLAKLGALLDHIDPNCGYADWTQVLMAMFHESQGSDAGLALVDAWSAKGDGYPGRRGVEAKWKSFSLDVANPVTIGTLIKRARRWR